MSSEGPKMVGGRDGLTRNGLKWPESQEKSGDPWWPPPPLCRPDPCGSNAAGRETLPA